MLSGLLLAAGLLATAANGKAIRARTSYAVKDSHPVPAKWTEHGNASPHHKIELRIGLKQDQFHELERQLYEVSDPSHDRYGQHLSDEDVKKLIEPTKETLDQVREWLVDNDVEEKHISYSTAKDWITVTLPVQCVEELLDTKYSIYRHEDGHETIRAPEWSLPLHLHKHIDTIQPTNSFFRTHPKAITLKVDNLPQVDGKDASFQSQYYSSANISSICNATAVTPDCLRTVYGTIDYVAQTNDTNIMGLADYLGETNNRSDTALFLSQFRPEAKLAANEFKFDVINNGSTTQVHTAAELEDGVDVEGNLDSETMLGIGWPTPLIAYTVGGSPPWKADNLTTTDTNEPYLAWLEYVLATPDNDLAKVISTSYDDNEQTVPLSYATRVCNDFAQLGARGVSVFFASGDSGVGGTGGCRSNNGTDAPAFLPEFPSSCPFVTSVGATMNFNPEIVAYHASGYNGGGGFSGIFPRPQYQDRVVKDYVKKLNGSYAGLYNPEGRAYPDISGQGSYYVTVWNGTNKRVSGTSASTPAIAAIFALVNDALIAAGRPTVGFLNPWLYKKGHKTFTDITSGSARGCAEISDGLGFPALPGWDAVTGWGTPRFKDILKALKVEGTFSTSKGAHGGKWVKST